MSFDIYRDESGYSEGHLRHLLGLLAASEKAQGRETVPPPTW